MSGIALLVLYDWSRVGRMQREQMLRRKVEEVELMNRLNFI